MSSWFRFALVFGLTFVLCGLAAAEDKKVEDKKPADKKVEEKKPADKKVEEKKPADKKPDEKKPADKKPDEKKPGAKVNVVDSSFTFPKGIELSADQKEKVAALKKEYAPKIEESFKGVNKIMTPERRKARQEAEKQAKADGKKGKELQAAVAEAVKLTDDEKQIVANHNKLLGEINKKKLELLTAEQKEKLKPKDKKPADKKPADKKPDEKKPVDKKPEEKKPVDKKPEEKKPVDKKPEEKKPEEKKPTEKEPAK